MDNAIKDLGKKIISELEHIRQVLERIGKDSYYRDHDPKPHEEKPRIDPPTPVSPLPSKPKTVESKSKRTKTPEEKKESRENATFWLEVIGAAVLTVYTGFTIVPPQLEMEKGVLPLR
jgi:hypothetical protein